MVVLDYLDYVSDRFVVPKVSGHGFLVRILVIINNFQLSQFAVYPGWPCWGKSCKTTTNMCSLNINRPCIDRSVSVVITTWMFNINDVTGLLRTGYTGLYNLYVCSG